MGLSHTGEKSRDVIAHWKMAFAVWGISSSVKTDNGLAHMCLAEDTAVSHKFGIQHSPMGQAIVERARGTLKCVLGR